MMTSNFGQHGVFHNAGNSTLRVSGLALFAVLFWPLQAMPLHHALTICVLALQNMQTHCYLQAFCMPKFNPRLFCSAHSSLGLSSLESWPVVRHMTMTKKPVKLRPYQSRSALFGTAKMTCQVQTIHQHQPQRRKSWWLLNPEIQDALCTRCRNPISCHLCKGLAC